MPWNGAYYYRSVRVNGKPRREYVGSGRLTESAAELDAQLREQRRLQREGERAARVDADALDTLLNDFDAAAEQLACAALVAADCRQHKRFFCRPSRRWQRCGSWPYPRFR